MSASNEKRYLDMLKMLILEQTKNHSIKIILFGSRAKGSAHPYSDIDIGLLPKTELPRGLISNLKEKVEESTIPYSVDIVDLSKTDEIFRDKVLREGIIWKD